MNRFFGRYWFLSCLSLSLSMALLPLAFLAPWVVPPRIMTVGTYLGGSALSGHPLMVAPYALEAFHGDFDAGHYVVYYLQIYQPVVYQTRFLLACRITKTRNIKDAEGVIEDAQRRTEARPKAFITDGLPAPTRRPP